jgi:putative ABC transport system permease protein
MLRAFRMRDADIHGWGARWRFRIAAMWNVLWNGLAERRRPGKREAVAVLGGLLPPHGTMGGGGGMDGWIKDLRFAWRTLWRNPGFAVVAVVTIALGIGANTAIFSVVRTVLLAPLPYEDPEELVMVWGEMRNRDVLHFPTSPPDFLDLREGTDLLEQMEAVFTFQQPLTAPDAEPVQIDAGFVTDGFFRLLGVTPALGRDFRPDDVVPNEPGVQPGAPGALPAMVILSHGLWEQRYGSDPDILGRVLQVGGAPAEVVGVLPEDFELLLPATAATSAGEVDLWTAARIDFANAPRNNVFLRPMGRLREGVTVEQAQAQIDRVAAELRSTSPVKESAGYNVRLEPLHQDLTAAVRPVLLALTGTVLFVLLIACANVANLLLVRASGRERELSVRAALGGSRRRLVRQMLLESGLLALLGAALGTLLAAFGIGLLPLLQPGDLPRVDEVRIDGTVLGVTALAALGAAVLFGLVPALQSSAADLSNSLKDRGGAGINRRRKFLQSSVVIAEVSLSVVLLIGAGLMVRSFSELSRVEPGYATDEVLTFNLALPPTRYPDAEDREAVMDRLQQEFEALPGVIRAAAAFPLPMSGQAMNGRYGPEEALTDPEAFRQAAYRAVRPGYFQAMGTSLLEGRTFEATDMVDAVALAAEGMEGGRGRVVIDEVLAESLWPGRSAIGETFLVRVFAPEPIFVEVVGVVEHQRNGDLARVGMPAVFFPDGLLGTIAGSWAVRAGTDPLAQVPRIREVVGSVDPDLPISDVRTMGSYVDEAMAPTRFALTLIGVFGLIALVLACVGLYGVLSYVVRQRTSEIGVRMAFGAERGNIATLVVRQGLGLAGAGLVLGLGAALGLSGFLESLMVGVSPTDPVTFGGIGLLFALVAALACYLPARRAARLDPVSALREE